MTVDGLARELHGRSPALARATAAFMTLAMFFAVAWAVDDRVILGINAWIKPFKFSVSIAIFLATLGWLLPPLPFGPKARTFVVWTPIISMVAEIVGIGGQAFRGTTSHFNAATSFDALVFSMMGVFILLNTIAVGMFAWGYWFSRVARPAAYLAGIRLGLLIAFLGMNEAWIMIARLAHTVGRPDGGPGLPLVNWSTAAGDLRVAHFVGMHAMQVLPLLGWWLSRRGGVGERAAVRAVRLSAVAYSGVAAALLALALFGVPLLPVVPLGPRP